MANHRTGSIRWQARNLQMQRSINAFNGLGIVHGEMAILTLGNYRPAVNAADLR